MTGTRHGETIFVICCFSRRHLLPLFGVVGPLFWERLTPRRPATRGDPAPGLSATSFLSILHLSSLSGSAMVSATSPAAGARHVCYFVLCFDQSRPGVPTSRDSVSGYSAFFFLWVRCGRVALHADCRKYHLLLGIASWDVLYNPPSTLSPPRIFQ